MAEQEVDRLRLSCPKCKSQDYMLVEVAEINTIFEVRNGVKPREAVDNEPGSIVRVECECTKCSHHWKPRGVNQWIDAIAD